MRRSLFAAALILCLVGLLCARYEIRPVRAIWIKPDGSIEPRNAPVATNDNITYTITDEFDPIAIERDDVVIDGGGHVVRVHYPTLEAVRLEDRTNVTVQNLRIAGDYVYTGIRLDRCSNCTIRENTIDVIWHFIDCSIVLYNSSHCLIERNNITCMGAST